MWASVTVMAELETLAHESEEGRTEGGDRKMKSDRKTGKQQGRQEDRRGDKKTRGGYRRGDGMADRKTEGQGMGGHEGVQEDRSGDRSAEKKTRGWVGTEEGKERQKGVMLVVLVVPVVLGSSSVNSLYHRWWSLQNVLCLCRSQKKMATQEGQLEFTMTAGATWTLLAVSWGQKDVCRAWTTTDRSPSTLDRWAYLSRPIQLMMCLDV